MPLRPTSVTGHVISAGRMTGAVKVRTTRQVYNQFLRKHFRTYPTTHVADPSGSLRTGDTVRITPPMGGIADLIEILAPWGPPLEDRPQIPGVTELERRRREKKEQRDLRKERRIMGEVEGEKVSQGGVEGTRGPPLEGGSKEGAEGVGRIGQRNAQKATKYETLGTLREEEKITREKEVGLSEEEIKRRVGGGVGTAGRIRKV
ncbi:hypothetical protein MMC25_001406 [Agyrium rufum]|nr:hypothetical protein [Agyrium rufum]